MSLFIGEVRTLSIGQNLVVVLVDQVEEPAFLKVYNQEEELVSEQSFHNLEDKPLRLLVEVPSGVLRFQVESLEKVLFRGPEITIANQLQTVYYMSCDHQEADTRVSLWDTLSREISSREGQTLCLHLGDNVYADAAWHTSQKNPETDAATYYRKRYRQVWNKGSRKDVYASASHLMIMDDHEIVNNLILSQNSNRITDAAISVYQEYQEALHYEKKTFIGRGWYKKINGILFIALERTTNGIVSSSEILSRLEEVIDETTTAIILCSGWAPIPRPEGNYYAELSQLLGTTRDYLPKEELILLYEYLLDWSSFDRPVLMIGGDIHFGVHAQVRKGFKRIDVIAASPISNHPSYDRRLAAKAYRGEIRLNSEIRMRVLEAKGSRCYARTKITQLGEDGYDFDNQLVFNTCKYPKNPLKYLRSVSKMAGL